MPSSIQGPTWALLSPTSLPSATEVKRILGAIVPNYEYPIRDCIPDSTYDIIPSSWFAPPTTDGNFKVALARAHGNEAHLRLGAILKAAFKKDTSNDLHLTSTIVKTYEVRYGAKIFQLLKTKHNQDILDLIDQAPKRNNKSVYAIQAIKTCRDAEMAVQDSQNESKEAETKLPINQATAMIGHPVPVPINPAGGVASTDTRSLEESHVAKGERIFAVQYRIIKKRSEWLRVLSKAKHPPGYELKELLIPSTPAMYGEDDAENDDGEELEEDYEDDDPLELGDLEHTWNLMDSAEGEIVMTSL